MERFDTIVVEKRGEVAVVTLSRPDKANAWTPHMATELAAAITAANTDPAIGTVVMTGAGRVFCGGADMAGTFATRIAGEDPGADTAHGSGGMPAGLDWVGLCRGSKPLIAAINGAAVGIGITMVLPFDALLASRTAKFGMGFIKVGLVPELASTHLLVQRMGFGRASEFALSGRIMQAAEALESGLVERLCDPETLVDDAVALAGAIAANPAPQLLMTKRLLTLNAAETDLELVQRRESEMLRECWASPEHAEAVAAFLEKRPPAFPPRAHS